MVAIKGLYKKRGWWYFSRMRGGVRKTIALETRDEDEAIHKALDLTNAPDLALGGTLEGEIESFIAFKLARNEFSRFSAENKSLTLKRFARWVGRTQIPSIKTGDLQRFYSEERNRVTESTAQGYMMCLRSFFGWLKNERKIIATNPATDISMGRWDYGTKTEYCQPELRDALLEGWRKIPIGIMSKEQARMIGFIMHAGFEAGLRRNEIVEARPSWFLIKGRSLRVQKTETFRPKDREARAIPLTDVFIAFLEKYPMDGTWCIAPEIQRGKSRYRYDFIRPFNLFVEFIGKELEQDLSWVTPHVMRHTFGSLLAIAGESLAKISEWMGDDPRVTDRHYLHFKEGDTAINKLHAFVPPPRSRQLPAKRCALRVNPLPANQAVASDLIPPR
ncbi:MAG: tyrosine-type recombinase/integrase [Terrimicrobiaceae bacterium]